MWTGVKTWLRELRLQMRDQLELLKPLPTETRSLRKLYEQRRQEQYCERVLYRIRRAWTHESSIELVWAASGKSWKALYSACRNCPDDHPMREDTIYVLMRKSATLKQKRKAARLLSTSLFTSDGWEKNEPWQP